MMPSRRSLDRYRARRNVGRAVPKGPPLKPGERRLAMPTEDHPVDYGHEKVWLDREKLTGGFALTRTGDGRRPRWLLVKVDDGGADARRNPVSTQPRSVVSGRTVEELADKAARA